MVTNRRMHTAAGSAVALAIALVAVSGCATKGYVKSQVAESKTYTDTQVTGVKGDLDQVKTKTDQAMDKASLAERLASGEVDYNEVSSHQVQFAFDDYHLDSDAQGMLDQMAGELQSHPGYVLEVRGYADARGSERYNYKLGRERADSVLRYMMTRHSVPTTRVAIVSFGEESPIADNETNDGRAQNRRVQVRVLELKPSGQQPMSAVQ
jgi:outer membrane protein OmpA-like peptidoglycan-associated protein